MRFDELVIERYGAIESRRVCLDGPGLTVVYGPNEAGKSTCLAAITDFLFRIPEGTARVGRFGSDVARLGARLRTADGRVLDLKRRYGRGRTLIDENGAPSDEGVLTSLLGSTTRDRFLNLFGLDHEALRKGGDALLRADGDIGRLIVEAGGGLRALMGRLDAIDAEMDTLFSIRKGANRAFYKALGEYDSADKTIRGATLTRDVYERDRKAHQRAAATLAECREVRRKLSERLSGLQRIERTIPVLRELDSLDARLADFADVSALAEDFPARTTAAYAALAAARAEFEQASSRHRDMAERSQAMNVDEALGGLEAAVRDIEARVAVVEAARASRANRSKELADAEAELAVLRHRLGVGPETDLEPLMPTSEAIDAVRALAAASMFRQSKMLAAREAVEEVTTSAAAIKARVARLVADGRDRPFGMSAAELASLPTEAAATNQKRSKATALEEEARKRLSVLGFEDADALRALPFPPDELIRSEIEQSKVVAAERTRQISVRALAETQRDVARAEQTRLRAEGVVATPEVLFEARRRRDEAWKPIHAAYEAATLHQHPQAERKSRLAAFATALIEADRVADARVTEAQRVAALIEAERRLTEAEATIEAAAAAEKRLATSLAEGTAAFTRAYPQSCGLVPELTSLLALSASRTEALTAAASAHDAQLEADQAALQLAPRLRLLALAEEKVGLVPSSEDDLVTRVQAATEATSAHDRAHADYGRDQVALADLETKLAAAQRTLSTLYGEEETWAAEWAVAAPSLGVPARTEPDVADKLAVRWDAARGELRAIAQTQRRLARMDEDEANLVAQIKAVAGSVSFALPDDPVAAGKMLADRWRTNDSVRVRKEALAPEVEAAAATVASSGRAVESCKQVLESLRAHAGSQLNDNAVQDAAKRRQELTAGHADRAKLIDAARTAGDRLEIATLRAKADGQDLDAISAEIEDVLNRIDAVDSDIEGAIRLEQQASIGLAAHEGPSTIGLAAVEREAAVVEMHAAIERYVELRLARGLLDRAIQQVRGEQQDPLVKEAGRLFAQMTRGEFDGVAADVDSEGGPVVVGLRSRTGVTQPVATMSDGTRDQLFLAFRLASLANYAAAAEPLPFIADDILVHFDDERGAATLDLLADFGASTQVLLFTHHRSVLSAAERLAADGRASIAEFSTL